jgi:hypothetical protein
VPIFEVASFHNNLKNEIGMRPLLALESLSLGSLVELASFYQIAIDGPKADILKRLQDLRHERGWSEADLLGGGPLPAAREVPVDQRQPALAPATVVAEARQGVMLNLAQPGAFDMAEAGRVKRWSNYLRDFDNYTAALGGIPPAQEVALFRHSAGPDFCRYAETLVYSALEGESQHKALLRTVSACFQPLDSSMFENFKLGEMSQHSGESTDAWVVRLRKQAASCDLKCPSPSCGASLVHQRLLELVLRHTRLARLRGRVLQSDLRIFQIVVKRRDFKYRHWTFGKYNRDYSS